ncbi:acyl carrier protein [Shewanella maritima]|uniref:Acyl carrier protein n=1 Tax=Shewanella maritima TaxID=2520507 RepID=A0A411PKG0_9GAMM|nr:acyl carrier protein [Shewanella maritima]QBF84008.1 acyl carrier protein [Shewanella maritima]
MNQAQQDITNTIIDYIKQHADEVSVTEHSNFVTEGLLDSFAILSLIMTLESEFSIKFTPIELADSSLQVVGGLAAAALAKMTSN